MPDANVPGEDDAQVFIFEKFGTLNTKANRPAIKDEEFAWVENWMQLGDGNLRTLYAEGASIYTAAGGRTIINVVYYNIGSTNYAAVFLDNGTAVQVNLAGGGTTTITASAGLLYDGTVIPTASQWEAKYLVIISKIAGSPNSYFIWDGTSFFGSGGVSPDTTITNAGTDYTSAPTVTAFGGTGSGATFLATVENGSVTKVQVINPGTGYSVNDDTIQLAFTGGGSDTSATATASVSTVAGGVAAVSITNSGTGHTTGSVLTFSGGGGSGAQAVITGLFDGAITEISVTNPGTGYTVAPTIAASVGSGFAAVVDIRYGYVFAVNVVNGGSGYVDNPQVVIGPPDSLSLPVLQASAVATVSGGVVTGFTMTQQGLGYTEPPVVTLVGGNNAAAGIVGLMPFGIAGSTIETFTNSIWTADGTKVSFTAPGTTSNFATSAGGGSFNSTDNFLRTSYVSLKQTNGTLYLIGDSSINGISNVQTTSSNGVSTTTFNNSNIDPQTGTPWRDSVTVFGRAIVFANSSGVYALYGGAAEKVSGPLDGLFTNATFNAGAGGGVVPSSAVATLFGIRCYIFLFTTINPYSGNLETLMTAWDGQKWFAASQINTMDQIAYSETNSVLTAYGATPTNIYPMFTVPSTGLTKVFQTKARAEPSLTYVKQLDRLYLTVKNTLNPPSSINISVDTERGPGASQALSIASSTGGIGIAAFNYQFSGVYGVYLGLTVTTTEEDLTLLALGELYRPYNPRV